LAEIRNPNASAPGSGGDMRSMLIFTLLALGALMAFQYFKPPVPPTAAPSAPATTRSATSSTAAAFQASSAAATIQAAAETTTVVENDLYRITFSNRGAQVKSWILKRYKDSHGRPLDLVNQAAAERFGFPLSLYTYEPQLTAQLNNALYEPSVTGQVAAPTGIVFRYAAGSLIVTKTFLFNQSYVIDVSVSVEQNGQPVRALVAWPSGLGDLEEAAQYNYAKFAYSSDGKRDTTVAKKISGGATLNQPFDYAGPIDLYFAATFLPADPADATAVTLRNTLDVPRDTADPKGPKLPEPVLGAAIGDQNGATHTRLFAGPLQYDVLGSIHTTAPDGKATGEDLRPLVQYGWFKVIAEPLFLLLRFVHDHMIPNWGWTIIVVTLFFNLLMLPTRFTMMKSSLKMQRVQPKLDAIKRKYANLKATDPRRTEMNAETMKLYKEEGINMYGGCLPLLVQMPLFFAYYRVLLNSIELRQASWGWLPNLAAADPLHILPILIIASMFLVQFITPSPGMDPAQRRMMAFLMPAIFGFSMWGFASGLALYWATGNLLNIGLQLGINRSKMGRELHALAVRRAAAKAPRTINARR
jgi:YidC/Oxa1 family membrane protein insertase